MSNLKDDVQMMFKEISESEGIPLIEFDDEGSCALPFGEEMMLFVQYDETVPAVNFVVPLGNVPSEKQAAIYGMLLTSNLFWKETHGATLALNPETQSVLLEYQELVAGLDTARLGAVLEGFLTAAEEWKERLQLNIDSVPTAEDEMEDEDEDDEYEDDGVEAEDDDAAVQGGTVQDFLKNGNDGPVIFR